IVVEHQHLELARLLGFRPRLGGDAELVLAARAAIVVPGGTDERQAAEIGRGGGHVHARQDTAKSARWTSDRWLAAQLWHARAGPRGPTPAGGQAACFSFSTARATRAEIGAKDSLAI